MQLLLPTRRNIPCRYDDSLVQECERILALLFSGISSEPKIFALVALFFSLLLRKIPTTSI